MVKLICLSLCLAFCIVGAGVLVGGIRRPPATPQAPRPLVVMLPLVVPQSPSKPKAETVVIKAPSSIPMGVLRSQYIVTVASRLGENEPSGTAVGIGPRMLLTASHVVSTPLGMDPNAKFSIEICNADGIRLYRIPIKILRIGSVADVDLATAGTEDELPHYVVPVARDVSVGDRLYAVGAQHGLSPWHASFGAVSAKHIIDFPNCWQISALCAEGNSGGGCFSEDGDLIGIVIARNRGAGNVSVIVPLNLILDFIR